MMKSGFIFACCFIFAVANPTPEKEELIDIAEPQEADFSREEREADSIEDTDFEREEREEDLDDDGDIEETVTELKREDRDIDKDEEFDDDENDLSAELDRQDRATPVCKVVRMSSAACPCHGKKLRRKLIVSLKLSKEYSTSRCIKDKTFGLNWNNRRVWVNNGCNAVFEICYLSWSFRRRHGRRHRKFGTRRCGKYTIQSCPSTKKCGRYFYRRSITSFDIAKEHSKSLCKKGDSFGFKKYKIWVSKGCDAEFKVCYKRRAPFLPLRLRGRKKHHKKM